MKSQLKNSFLLLLLTSFFLLSCLKKIALNAAGVFDTTASAKYITNGEKEIIFLSMHHIGKEDFYNSIKLRVDSLIKKEFIVFFEAVRAGKVRDSLQKDTLYRKGRKITGVDFVTLKSNGGYLDTAKNSLMGLKIKYKLVNQPLDLLSGFDTLKCKNIDANFLQLINACESKYGPVVLDQTDFEKNTGKKYKPEKNKERKEYFLLEFRNRLIADSILSQHNNKIVLIYGDLHFDGILKNLQTADKRFKKVDGL